MKRSIRLLSELPAWFDLKSYTTDREDYLDGQARIGQIFRRMTLYNAIKENTLDREILLNQFDSIIKNPFNDIALELRMERKTELEYSLFTFEMMKKSFGGQVMPIKEPTIGGLLNRLSKVDAKIKSDLSYYNRCEATKSFTYAYAEAGERLGESINSIGISGDGKALLEIDLTASDKIITSQFSEWLKGFRAKNEKIPEISKNGEFLLGRIKSYNLLAFIDLYFLWAEIEGVTIKPSLAARFFGFSESEISKTIKPLAHGLLSSDSETFKQLCVLGHNPARYMVLDLN